MTFEYAGYHFTPLRAFRKNEGGFFEITRMLERDPKMGLWTYKEGQRFPYSHKSFFEASTDKECDIFFCRETEKLYVPCENELFIFNGKKD